MRLPDFLIIGAAKAGTTSLASDLGRHPGIHMSHPKEPEFFGRDEKYARGLEDYGRLFEDARADQLAGEASTLYTMRTWFPEVPERIHRALPGARLVYVVREPVARTHSFWLQQLKNQDNFGGDLHVPRNFEAAIEREPALVETSDYRFQLLPYLERYDASQVHVMVFEEYTQDRPAALRALADFLGIDPAPFTTTTAVHENSTSAHFRDRAADRALSRIAGSPAGTLARRMLPPTLRTVASSALRSALRKAPGMRERTPPPPLAETRSALRERFAPSVEWLEAFLGRPIPAWKTLPNTAQARSEEVIA